MYVVERAKKCLDFAATAHILHFLGTIIYNQTFPASWTWWIVNVICLIIMSVLGEYLCMNRELQEIPLTRKSTTV